MENSREIIQVKNLVRNFGKIRALDGISFSVKEGEFFGFLGPNGAGKTTTIKILCTLLSPTSGQVILNDYNVVKNPSGVRQSIGMVFQEESLDENLTAWENLKFHCILYNIPAIQHYSRMVEVLETVGLTSRKDDFVGTFSGGMKRRLEVARGLLHRPRILFLDEPTLGLDPQTRRHIWNYIQELRKKETITIFLTTHYMDEAEFADRVGVIDYGRIIALDTVNNLKTQVGGDVVRINTEDNTRAFQLLQQNYKFKVQIENGQLRFEVPDAANFIPQFIKEFPVTIITFNSQRPTLDDVFLSLTGRQIRE